MRGVFLKVKGRNGVGDLGGSPTSAHPSKLSTLQFTPGSTFIHISSETHNVLNTDNYFCKASQNSSNRSTLNL